MLLENKKILIMGIRNKWSIAYGIAKSAYENGAKLIFTYLDEESKPKIEALVEEFEGSKLYLMEDASIDEKVEELANDFIYTSKDGYAHAMGVSAYSLILVSRVAKELDMLAPNASIITLTYLGSEKVMQGYNVMGAAKAALEANVRYLANDLGKDGIRINAISAGPIKTLSARGIKNFSSILDIVEEKAPLKRNVTPYEIGQLTTTFLSEMTNAVTGQVIYSDCGYSIMG